MLFAFFMWYWSVVAVKSLSSFACMNRKRFSPQMHILLKELEHPGRLIAMISPPSTGKVLSFLRLMYADTWSRPEIVVYTYLSSLQQHRSVSRARRGEHAVMQQSERWVQTQPANFDGVVRGGESGDDSNNNNKYHFTPRPAVRLATSELNKSCAQRSEISLARLTQTNTEKGRIFAHTPMVFMRKQCAVQADVLGVLLF